MAFLKELQDLIIPFNEIKLSTRNFTTIIGKGGYGPVYKAELSLSGKLTTVAVKRLQFDNRSGQGLKEFLTEIQLLSRYKHQNLVCLSGFCQEGKENLLIYEFAEGGSLDKYLRTTCTFTWKQRINICIDASRGLDYLHNHAREDQRVIHRDIKSGNILLDHNLKAMVADFGLSKVATSPDSYLITNPAGTEGYCDPAYIHTGVLTKESDIYSFGVVLFEVLCGRLCFININSKLRFLPQLAKLHYEQDTLDEIIDPYLMKHVGSESVKEFSRIAYQCLQEDRNERPSMNLVLQKLEQVLASLEVEEACDQLQIGESPTNYEVVKSIHRIRDTTGALTRRGIHAYLSTGILVNEGKVWLSKNDSGHYQEMISAIDIMHLDERTCQATSAPESRFPMVVDIFKSSGLDIELKIRTHHLSFEIIYAAYLVFKPLNKVTFEPHITLTFINRGDEARKSLRISYAKARKDDEWMMVELFQTINFERKANFEITLLGFGFDGARMDGFCFEGIEFLPIHKFEDEVRTLEVENLQKYPLPRDYHQYIYHSTKEMMEMRPNDIIFPTLKDAYSILSRGVLINTKYEVHMWFWITSNGRKCFMLPPSELYYDEKHVKFKPIPSSESRFESVLELSPSRSVGMGFDIRNGLTSTRGMYVCYLVYNIPDDLVFETPFKVKTTASDYHTFVVESLRRIIYLTIPQCPVIGSDGESRSHISVREFPRKRKDGWWEVRLGEFNTYIQPATYLPEDIIQPRKSMCVPWFRRCMSDNDTYDPPDGIITFDPSHFRRIMVRIKCIDNNIQTPYLIVQGIEFRSAW